MVDFGPGSVEVGPEPRQGEGRIRRNFLVAEGELAARPMDGMDTVYDILVYTDRTYGSKNAVGYRDIVETHFEEKEVTKIVGGKEVKEKKKWSYFELSEFKYLTFTELREAAEAIGRGLADLGFKRGDIFNIYSATRYGFPPAGVTLCDTHFLVTQRQLAVNVLWLCFHLSDYRNCLRYPW